LGRKFQIFLFWVINSVHVVGKRAQHSQFNKSNVAENYTCIDETDYKIIKCQLGQKLTSYILLDSETLAPNNQHLQSSTFNYINV